MIVLYAVTGVQLRAKDKNFNAEIRADFEKSIGKISIVPQDIGKAILNLINNAFYAVRERQNAEGMGYEPTVTVTTRKLNDKVDIKVTDNGKCISKNIVAKIFATLLHHETNGTWRWIGLVTGLRYCKSTWRRNKSGNDGR